MFGGAVFWFVYAGCIKKFRERLIVPCLVVKTETCRPYFFELVCVPRYNQSSAQNELQLFIGYTRYSSILSQGGHPDVQGMNCARINRFNSEAANEEGFVDVLVHEGVNRKTSSTISFPRHAAPPKETVSKRKVRG